MGASWRIARFFGIPIDIDFSGILVAAVIAFSLATGAFPSQFPNFTPVTYGLMGIAAAILLFVSVVAHELSHALVARRDGLVVEGITLFAFGGIARLAEEPRTAREEFRMAVAGPACSLGLGFVLIGALLLTSPSWWNSALASLVAYIAAINVALGLFNLAPGFPLDGGRILRALLWRTTHNLRRATWMSAALGQAVALLLAFWGGFRLYEAVAGTGVPGGWLSGIFLIFTGVFLAEAARRSYRLVAEREAVRVSADEPVRR